MIEPRHVKKWQEDLELIASFLANRGLPNSPRVEQLRGFLRWCTDDAARRFEEKYGPEYLVYSLEYIDFFADQVRRNIPIDDNTLRRIFSGSFDFAREMANGDDSRNLVLQIRAAMYLAMAGFECRITDGSDVIASDRRHTYAVECKRVYSMTKVQRRAREAADQIAEGVTRISTPKGTNQKRQIGGIVWLDVTPLLLELRALVPVYDEMMARAYNLYLLRGIGSPIAAMLSEAKCRDTKFVVAQGSVQFLNLTTGEAQCRVATYIKQTRHCGMKEGRRFSKATSYLQGYRRGPDVAGTKLDELPNV